MEATNPNQHVEDLKFSYSLSATSDRTLAEEVSHPRADLQIFLKEEDDAVADIIRHSVPIFSDRHRRFKYGGCPHHLTTSLQPHLIQSGDNKGCLVLRCSQFWKKNSSGQRLCFYKHEFPMGLFRSLPQNIQDAYVDIRNALSRNACSRRTD